MANLDAHLQGVGPWRVVPATLVPMPARWSYWPAMSMSTTNLAASLPRSMFTTATPAKEGLDHDFGVHKHQTAPQVVAMERVPLLAAIPETTRKVSGLTSWQGCIGAVECSASIRGRPRAGRSRGWAWPHPAE